MRKQVLWVALATIAMTSCTKTEVLNLRDNSQVGYSAGIGKQIKSGPINGTTFPTDDANYFFSVFAFYKEEGEQYDYNSPYIDDEPVKWNGTYWMNETIQYWPASGSLQFVAYAPYVSIENPSYNATDGLSLPDFKDVPDIDLMYTEPTADLTSGTVPFTFKHALTQILFTIATTSDDVVFTIKRLRLKGFASKGSFKTLPSPTWELSSDIDFTGMTFQPYNDATGIDISLGDQPVTLGDAGMLIPQPIDGFKVEILYDVTYPDITGADNKKEGLTKEITLSGAAWQPNQRIKYAITITDGGPNAITYEPTVTTWDTETTSDI